jgi:lipopolysaccharide export system permease protein
MPILSRYVLRQFLSPLGLGLVCFLAIFIVIDLVDRLGAFIDRDVEVGLIVTYYLWYVPYVAVLILPMSLLLASLFSVGGLARRQELTAMKATGASLYRILLPVQLFALLLSIAAFFFRLGPSHGQPAEAGDR